MFTGRWLGGVNAMSWPSMTISPALGRSRPASILSSVVLPQPEGPSRAKNSLRRIASDTLSTATIGPKRLVTASTVLILVTVLLTVIAVRLQRPERGGELPA